MVAFHMAKLVVLPAPPSQELGGSFPMDRLPPGGDVPQDLVDKTFR